MNPFTLYRESHFQLPRNCRGKKNHSATNIGRIAICLFILQSWKCSCDGCVINNLVRRHFDQSKLHDDDQDCHQKLLEATRVNTPEKLSMQSLPVWPLHGSVWHGDHSRLGASLLIESLNFEGDQYRPSLYLTLVWRVRLDNPKIHSISHVLFVSSLILFPSTPSTQY